jgi:hypothetical protein
MFNLLTSLSVVGDSFLSHLSHLNATVWSNDVILDSLQFYRYGFGLPVDNIRTSENVLCACTSFSSDSSPLDLTDQILVKYLGMPDGGSWDGVWLERASCIILDPEKNHLWLLSDSLASHPLWYAFKPAQIGSKFEWIVSEDLVGVARLGFLKPTSVGSSQNLLFDLKSMELLEAVNTVAKVTEGNRY